MNECYIYKDSNYYKSLLFAVARRAQDCIEESHFFAWTCCTSPSCSYMKLSSVCGTGIKKDQITLK